MPNFKIISEIEERRMNLDHFSSLNEVYLFQDCRKVEFADNKCWCGFTKLSNNPRWYGQMEKEIA